MNTRRFRALTASTEPGPNHTGAVRPLLWPGDDDPLPHLQKAVHGRAVSVVRLRHTLNMWINEDAPALGFPANPIATSVAQSYGEERSYFGTVVFTGGPDEEGNLLPLPPGHEDELLERDPFRIRCCDCGRVYVSLDDAERHWIADHDVTGADYWQR